MTSRSRVAAGLLVVALASGAAGSGAKTAPATGWELVVLRSRSRELVESVRDGVPAAVADRLSVVRRAGEWALVGGPFAGRAEAEALRARLGPCCAGAAVVPAAEPDDGAPVRSRRDETRREASRAGVRVRGRVPAVAGVDPARSGLGSGRVLPERRPLVFPGRERDERALWRLFHRGEYARLADTIDRWRRTAPSWRPPAELLALLERAREESAWDAARENSDASRIVALAARRPELFTCARVDRLLALEQAWRALDRPQRAEAVLALVMVTCEDPDARREALRRASAGLPFVRFAALARRVRETSPELRPVADALLVARGAERLGEAGAEPDERDTLRIEAAISGAVLARRDADVAVWLGWRHLDAGRDEQAAAWFGHALAFDPDREEAARGLVESLLRRGERARARAVLATWAGRSEPLARRLAGLEREDAARALADGDAAACLAHLARASTLDPAQDDDPDRLALGGWCLLEAGRPDEALRAFLDAYRASPSEEAADALAIALGRAGRREELPALAGKLGGPLARHAAAVRADRELARGRVLAAAREAGGVMPLLVHVAAPRLGAATALRRRSGTPGLDRLRALAVPVVLGDVVRRDVWRLGFRVERLDLDAGTPPPGALVGSVPAGGWPGVPAIRSSHTGLVVPRLLVRGEEARGWFGELATTPLGAGLPATPVFRAGWTDDRRDDRSLLVEAFREPVTDSVLSWIGLDDPGAPGAWGRVVRLGVRGALRRRVAGRWTVTAGMRAARLSGHGVASNDEIAASLEAQRPLPMPRSWWAVAGPELRVMRYARNLGRFTRGHGGYFSPQRYLWAGIGASAGRAPGPRLVVQARAALGWEAHRQEASPFLPLAPDGRMHPAGVRSGAAGTLEVRAVWRLAGRWQLGAAAAWRRSGDWTEQGATLTLRYVLGARAAVFPFDLPDAPL